MNNETEHIFLSNSSNTQPLAIVPKINDVSASTPGLEDFSTVCRTCATVTEFVIPIFNGEGLQNNLADKIHKHLPIQCASTLLAWHELVQCCVQADAALRARLAVAAANTATAAAAAANTTTAADTTVRIHY
ncbi:unnamed protein product [Diatraea saccharalis]|uniref:Uncharacterized protein n=1 Tax=Diatraea saccharalis TaxID=40085 RepID=A0A9N9WFC2_9NEOP|nr:unnamed protein product [Diatraea saccharalis]